MKWLFAIPLACVATPSLAAVPFNGNQTYTLPGATAAAGNQLYLGVNVALNYTLTGSFTITSGNGDVGIRPVVTTTLSSLYAGSLNSLTYSSSYYTFSSGAVGDTVNFSLPFTFTNTGFILPTDGSPGLINLSQVASVSPIDLGAFGVTVNNYALAFTSGQVDFTYFERPGASAVPEAATWAMMIAGFGMMGSAMRYRRRSAKVTFA